MSMDMAGALCEVCCVLLASAQDEVVHISS